jgi:multidrug efflux pump subunit AcrA (membrane-fusion protein)
MRLFLGLLVAVAVGACSARATSPPSPSPSPRVHLGISNGTTLDVTLVVNGQRVADYPTDGSQLPAIDDAALPPLPWDVEVRSPSGRVLLSMHVKEGQVSTATDAGGYLGGIGRTAEVDLSCGRLMIWAGDFTPTGGGPPQPSPGTFGDCAP